MNKDTKLSINYSKIRIELLLDGDTLSISDNGLERIKQDLKGEFDYNDLIIEPHKGWEEIDPIFKGRMFKVKLR